MYPARVRSNAIRALALSLGLAVAGCASQSEQAKLAGGGASASTVSALIEAGDLNLAQGDYPGAVALYRSAHNAAPQDPLPLVKLGYALAEGGSAEEATGAFRAALTHDPLNADARRGMGNALVSIDEPALALPHFEQAQKLTPDDYRVYLGMGVAQDLLGNHDEAKAVYRQGLESSPDNMDLRHNLGLSHVLAGEMDEGLSLLRTIANHSGAPAQYRQTLAMGYALAGLEQEARAVASLDLGPAAVERNMAFYQTLRAMEDPAQRLRSIQAFYSSESPAT